MCPYCGFNLSSRTQARQLYLKGGRSLLLSVIIVLTSVSGAIDIIQGFSASIYEYALYVYPIPPPAWAGDLMLVQVALGALFVPLGIAQVVVAYGLLHGKAFSRRYLLRLVTLVFLLFLAALSFDSLISTVVPLSSAVLPLDAFYALWSFLVFVVTWRYVIQHDKREWLSSSSGGSHT